MREWVVGGAWVVFYLWLLGGAFTLASVARQKFLRPSAKPPREDKEEGEGDDEGTKASLVSVLVPARNEEGRILAECLRTILAQDYPSIEVVAVNDRSTDRTGEILRSIAERDARLRVIEGAGPPAGWLGKPYALQQALEASRGPWVLATDADMILHPSALSTAVTYARSHRLEAFSALPRFEAVGFWERVFIPVWGWSFLLLYPLDIVNHPASPLAVGIGGFFLIKRDALALVGGFGAVRADVLDDFRLASALKKSGARIRAEYAPELARTRMYTNLRGLWESATKNWFAAFNFSAAFASAGLIWTLAVGVLPQLLALLSGLLVLAGAGGVFWRELLLPTGLTYLLSVAVLAVVSRRGAVPARYALTAPLGFALACAILAYSAFGVVTGRGLRWKGRKFYERSGVRPPRRRA